MPALSTYNTPILKAGKEAIKHGVLSQGELYSRIASKQHKIIKTAFLLLDSRNDNVRLGATKLLMDRIIPARKAVEVSGSNGEPIQFILATQGGFIPERTIIDVTPEASNSERPSEVQSIGMAQESKKDNNSDNGDNQAGVS